MAKKRGSRAKSRSNSKPRKKPRQSIEVIIRKRILGEAPKDRHFIVADGRKVKNILELADALETMSEEMFTHHANELKNDFSIWVKDVFYDHSLADDISRARNRLEAQIAVLRRMVKELM